jgi:hypothetical protein
VDWVKMGIFLLWGGKGAIDGPDALSWFLAPDALSLAGTACSSNAKSPANTGIPANALTL